MRRFLSTVWPLCVGMLLAPGAGAASAQGNPPPVVGRAPARTDVQVARRPQLPPPPGPGAAPAQVQAWFDRLVLVQAQRALALTDDQYPQFVTRLRALQDARRQAQRERNQIIQEMQKLTAPANTTVDEVQVRAKLKALEEAQGRTAAAVKSAYDGIDQVLSIRQQARFRVFEEQIERRKFDLLLNARRRAAVRAGRGQLLRAPNRY